ncbi:MAG TPA: periplasmic heavy metal sensor [Vicinamibacteria bacterium]|jgi:Spy/CpxP family protein refolding chaperone|nr:periplasmic heavy metal sensor [Vicinamibacteria bacterium]HLQ63363.1 periplasmic heavy metal sensor [bacterium]
MVKSGLLMLIVLVLLGGTSLSAQPRMMRPPVDPLGENLFPPELVMQHQQALELTEEQRNLIRGEIQNAQARFTEVQWQLQNEMETMASLVKQGRIDEQRTLTQLDKIVGLEREIKRTQLALLIRVKNSLTPEQQAKLQTLRRQ